MPVHFLRLVDGDEVEEADAHGHAGGPDARDVPGVFGEGGVDAEEDAGGEGEDDLAFFISVWQARLW